jgi:hypothetical protein
VETNAITRLSPEASEPSARDCRQDSPAEEAFIAWRPQGRERGSTGAHRLRPGDGLIAAGLGGQPASRPRHGHGLRGHCCECARARLIMTGRAYPRRRSAHARSRPASLRRNRHKIVSSRVSVRCCSPRVRPTKIRASDHAKQGPAALNVLAGCVHRVRRVRFRSAEKSIVPPVATEIGESAGSKHSQHDSMKSSEVPAETAAYAQAGEGSGITPGLDVPVHRLLSTATAQQSNTL